MRKKSKISTIVRAFSETEALVPEDILQERRDACKNCPYNSANARKEDLSLIDLVRKKLNSDAPHCTLCGCFIDKKTSQPNEECALSTIGEEPKWNRLRVEIVSKNSFDMVNNAPDKMSVDLSKSGDEFEIKFPPVEIKTNKHVFVGDFSLIYPKNSNVDIQEVSVSCGCTATSERVEDGLLRVPFTMTFSRNSLVGREQNISKSIYVKYLMNGKAFRLKINLSSHITWI